MTRQAGAHPGAGLVTPGAPMQLDMLDLFDGTYCQRWTLRRASWRRTSEGGFDADRYSVAPIAEDDARAFVLGHHYSGTYPAARLRYGMFDWGAGGALVGVAVLGVPMRADVLTKPFPSLVPYRESLELSRLVLVDAVPANAETWFTARAFEHAAGLGLRGVVMFSDPLPRMLHGVVTMPGHVGTIYQSLGRVRYTGRGTARTLTMLPDGTVLPARSMQKVRAGERGAAGVVARLLQLGAVPLAGDPAEWLNRELARIGATKVRHQGNHRYAIPIGTRAQARHTPIGLPSHPFPKQPDTWALAA
jgi:hypothetical protein